jgi:hypothetical protein
LKGNVNNSVRAYWNKATRPKESNREQNICPKGRETSKGIRHHPLKRIGSTGQQNQKPDENPLKDEAGKKILRRMSMPANTRNLIKLAH